MSVINNTPNPESALKVQCNAIAYHVVCKSMAMTESLTGYIRSENNPAELLTQVIAGQKRKRITLLVLCDVNELDTKQLARNISQ